MNTGMHDLRTFLFLASLSLAARLQPIETIVAELAAVPICPLGEA